MTVVLQFYWLLVYPWAKNQNTGVSVFYWKGSRIQTNSGIPDNETPMYVCCFPGHLITYLLSLWDDDIILKPYQKTSLRWWHNIKTVPENLRTQGKKPKRPLRPSCRWMCIPRSSAHRRRPENRSSLKAEKKLSWLMIRNSTNHEGFKKISIYLLNNWTMFLIT